MSYSYNNDQGDEDKRASAQQVVPEGGKAIAEGKVVMNSASFQAFLTACASGGSEVWTQSRLAGIAVAKKADELMLSTHTVTLSGIEMDYSVSEEEKRITVRCEVRTKERIGADMCALAGCGMALMSLVNNLRAVDSAMKIEELRIVRL